MKIEHERMTLTIVKQMEALLSTLHNEPVRIAIIFSSKEINLDMIKNLICVGFGLEWKTITQANKKQDIIYARMSFCYLSKNFTSLSNHEIGKFISKDRTTVIANHRVIGNLFDIKYESIYPILKTIINQLNHLKNETKKVQN